MNNNKYFLAALSHIEKTYSKRPDFVVTQSLMKKWLKRDPHPIESALIYLGVIQQYKKNNYNKQIFSSVEFVFNFLTGLPESTYKNNGRARNFMAWVWDEYVAELNKGEVIEKDLLKSTLLQNGAVLYDSRQGKARTLGANYFLYQDFLDGIYTEIIKKKQLDKVMRSTRHKKTSYGEGFATNRSQIDPLVVRVMDKLQAGTFRINPDVIRTIPNEHILTCKRDGTYDRDRLHGITLAFGDIAATSEDQYNGKIHQQYSGRKHTTGGLLPLPKEYLKTLLVAKEGHVLVDIDLESAQLRLLARELGATKLLDKLNTLHIEGKKIWDLMGKGVTKDVLKTALYAYCFFCPVDGVVPLIREKHGDKSFSDTDLSYMLYFLDDLPGLREEWIKKNPPHKLKSKINERNKLGLRFTMDYTAPKSRLEFDENDLINYIPEPRKNYRGRYMSWKMQSEEQYIMHRFIDEMVTQNIVNFRYDGIILEVKECELEATIQSFKDYMWDEFGMFLSIDVWSSNTVQQGIDRQLELEQLSQKIEKTYNLYPQERRFLNMAIEHTSYSPDQVIKSVEMFIKYQRQAHIKHVDNIFIT